MPAEEGKIAVLIADDHPLVREGIRKILSLEPRIVVVGEAADGHTVIELARKLKPRIILMDINLPLINGLEATRVIRREVPQAEVIALTIHEEEEYIMELFRAGAAGYLLKDISAEGLVEAILQVAQGVPVIHPGVTKKMLRLLTESPCEGPKAPGTSLTRREKEILAYVVKGESNKQIARRLYISEKTVKNHLTRIFRKIGVQDRTQAAVYALKHGLTDATLE
ncbi:two component transcriptional regulator, LuxR family [Thermanaeromonas toyohensis ToBE]|uniref:Stage 0 sporulation protein A homolog n=1 Tax=Thermanaeromonas toyohensis ToBE TaxID=698762 RepID=A0A1W1VPU4_9FIRM|nr:response regulator transcription factor [Thermanaeromonas toyohensis]SMB95356.1 two component transcriptional regulator, LuxR family [Thermanaeromonas toyohensis ToBE]